MRRVALHIAALIVVVSCGGATASEPAPIQTPATPSTITTTTIATTTTAEVVESEPVDEGPHTDSLPEGATLVAGATTRVEVFADPADTKPLMTLEPTTILGTTTVLSVIEGPDEGWARVMLPIRPNQSEGWVRTDEMKLYVVNGSIIVDLSERSLSYFEHGEEVLSTTVAVGSPRNPTPTGSFFVTDHVNVSDPTGPWGPHAFGLSARSDTITEFNGGDGIIGIHGTNKPGSIGHAASLGCVRVPNDVILRLHEMIKVGTPVEIRA